MDNIQELFKEANDDQKKINQMLVESGQARKLLFGDRTDRGGLNHILWTTETAIEKIKQHFGVEP